MSRSKTAARLGPVGTIIALSMLAASCSSEPGDPPQLNAFVAGDSIVLEYDGRRWDFMAGVNLGATIPGHYPGELAINAETYRRWFPMMADVGFGVIRVYTIQNPAFYRELREYNLENPSRPLFLVQGVWIDEERFLEVGDLYDEIVTSSFDAEIADAVDVVAGDADLPERPGHAGGRFDSDVTNWLAGWIIGIELDPTSVLSTDETNSDVVAFDGEFFSSSDGASPTESWLAARLDRLAGELSEHDLAMPLAFTNWPTTDPLTHPYEPIRNEDMVGIDPNHVVPNAAWTGGYFASYHAYPYFPDFQKFDPALNSYVHINGEVDPYAGYLAELRDHHAGLPVVIAEFGVSGGMGRAHHGPIGRHQGALSEQRQMAIDAEMLEIMHDVGLAGGLVFEWADEWFKFTWNTTEYELPPDRRALWDNQWTNEAQFGVLAVEPGFADSIMIGGDIDDWRDIESITPDGSDASVNVRAHHDPGFLYLLLEFAGDTPDRVTLGFDVVPGMSGGLPGEPGVHPGADIAVTFGPGTEGQALFRASDDPIGIRFGLNAPYLTVDPDDYVEGNGVWNPQRQITSYPLTVPATGERIEAEFFDVGELVHGVSDPTAEAFDSRAGWFRHPSAIEVRIPHPALGITDPSSRQALVVAQDGSLSAIAFERIGISVLVDGQLHTTGGYTWEPWQAADWHERLRVGSEALTEVLTRIYEPQQMDPQAE